MNSIINLNSNPIQSSAVSKVLECEDTLTKIAEFLADTKFSLVCKDWHASNRNASFKNREFALLLQLPDLDVQLKMVSLVKLKKDFLSLLQYANPKMFKKFQTEHSKSSIGEISIQSDIYALLHQITSFPGWKPQEKIFTSAMITGLSSLIALMPNATRFEYTEQKEGKEMANFLLYCGFGLTLYLIALAGVFECRDCCNKMENKTLKKCELAAAILQKRAEKRSITLKELPAMDRYRDAIPEWFATTYKENPALSFI